MAASPLQCGVYASMKLLRIRVTHHVTSPKLKGKWMSRAQMLKAKFFETFCLQMPPSLPWQPPSPRCFLPTCLRKDPRCPAMAAPASQGLSDAPHMSPKSPPDALRMPSKCFPVPGCLPGAAQESQACFSRRAFPEHFYCKSMPTDFQNT